MCGHVVNDASAIYAISEYLNCNQRVVDVRLIASDLSRALALVQADSEVFRPLPLLRDRCPDVTKPLLIVTWPGWEAFLARRGTPDDLTKCALRAAVVTEKWGPGDGLKCGQFSFAGRVEGGMSGGPVVSALTAEVVGIVTQSWDFDGFEIGETWYSFASGTLAKSDLPPADMVAAQIDLGTGMAVDVGELWDFLSEAGVAYDRT